MKKILPILLIIFLTTNNIHAEEKKMILKLKNGDVEIELFPKIAPKHVERFEKLANEGKYDGVVFHRVIDGFMAQTGDVQFGNTSSPNYDLNRAGTGGSKLPNIPAEFSDANHGRGALSMARSQSPDSANSQFFIVFNDASFLDGQYTVWGQVVEGMELVDNIKRGEPAEDPDKIIKMEIITE